MAAIDWPTLAASLSAIDADPTLTPAARRAQRATTKCVAIVDALTAFHALPWPPYTVTRSGVTWTLTLTRVAVLRATGEVQGGHPVLVEDAAGGLLGLWVTALKAGVPVRWRSAPDPCWLADGTRADVQFVWPDPRVLIADGTGTITSPSGRTGCRFDLVALAQALLNDNVLAEAR